MRICFSSATLYHRGLVYTLHLAREAGFAGIELALGHDYLLGGLNHIERVVRRSGIPVLSVHPPFVRLPGWPRLAAQRIATLARLTRLVHAEVLVLHTPAIYSLSAARTQRYVQGVRVGQEDIGDAQITIENDQFSHRPQRYVLDDLATLTRFAGELGCGVTFDTCHAGANGQDLIACYEIVRPLLRNVHLSDVVWREGVPVTHRLPGEGELPLREFLARLASDGYDGLITVELHPAQVGLVGRAHQARRLRKALEFVRSAIDQPTPHPTPTPERG
jgi:sugar phosphate isomerase/epimerase